MHQLTYEWKTLAEAHRKGSDATQAHWKPWSSRKWDMAAAPPLRYKVARETHTLLSEAVRKLMSNKSTFLEISQKHIKKRDCPVSPFLALPCI